MYTQYLTAIKLDKNKKQDFRITKNNKIINNIFISNKNGNDSKKLFIIELFDIGPSLFVNTAIIGSKLINPIVSTNPARITKNWADNVFENDILRLSLYKNFNK